MINKQLLAKVIVKGTLGLGVSAIIGATIKQEAHIQDALEAFFTAKAGK